MENKNIHFVGCGGVGVAGVAHIAADLGYAITGSDEVDSAMLQGLRLRGVDVFVGHRPQLPENTGLLVYSSAVPADDPERQMALLNGIPQMRRGEFLAELSGEFKQVVAIGGSHGKTTTTAMVAHILKKLGYEPGFMVGATVMGWERSASAGTRSVLVTEVDESDGTQAILKTDIAMILNVDDDHFWSLGGEDKLVACFKTFAGLSKYPMIFSDDEKSSRIFADVPGMHMVDIDNDITLPIPGTFNIRNASAAVRISELLGCRRGDAIAALTDFPGVARRMNLVYSSDDNQSVVVEDYAHHPTELYALLSTMALQFPQGKIIAFFQPHRFERLEFYGERFAALLAKYCSEVRIVSTFAAWNENHHGVSAEMLVDEINRLHPGIAESRATETLNLVREIRDILDANEKSSSKEQVVILVIGAGNIGAVAQELRRY